MEETPTNQSSVPPFPQTEQLNDDGSRNSPIAGPDQKDCVEEVPQVDALLNPESEMFDPAAYRRT